MKKPPVKKQGHTQAEELKHLKHRVHELEELVERLMSTAADLTAAIADITNTIANLPPPAPALIDQATLDASVQAVKDADAALKTKTTP